MARLRTKSRRDSRAPSSPRESASSIRFLRRAFFGRATSGLGGHRPKASSLVPGPLLLPSFPREHPPITTKTSSSRREDEKRIRNPPLCDRTRPKRDRNEAYRVCERKHGTCFSSVVFMRILFFEAVVVSPKRVVVCSTTMDSRLIYILQCVYKHSKGEKGHSFGNGTKKNHLRWRALERKITLLFVKP